MYPSKKFVYEKLMNLGNVLLKNPYKDRWSSDNPTYGYCYVVSEAIYHYINKEVKVYCMNLGEDIGTHWFVKIDDNIVDYTCDQFGFEIDYSKAVGKGFFKGGIKTDKGFISKRGYEMAKVLELI